jgi:hypothetical protein
MAPQSLSSFASFEAVAGYNFAPMAMQAPLAEIFQLFLTAAPAPLPDPRHHL